MKDPFPKPEYYHKSYAELEEAETDAKIRRGLASEQGSTECNNCVLNLTKYKTNYENNPTPKNRENLKELLNYWESYKFNKFIKKQELLDIRHYIKEMREFLESTPGQ